jgi:hypothetical protein
MLLHDPVFIDNRFIDRIGKRAGRTVGNQNVYSLSLNRNIEVKSAVTLETLRSPGFIADNLRNHGEHGISGNRHTFKAVTLFIENVYVDKQLFLRIGSLPGTL